MATNKRKKEDETMKHPVKRSLAILLALAILAGLCILPASAASFPSSLYLRQITNVSCTRASNTMMCRARAYLSGNDNWSSITEYDLTNCGAWSDSYGMTWNYTLSKPGDGIHSISVSETAVNGLSLGTVKALLNAHPEGFVMYCSRLPHGRPPHGIFITDYAGDTIYCSDPGWGYSGDRRPLTSSYFGTCYGSQANILANVTAYWYVAGYNISSSGNAPTGWLDSVTSDGVGRIHVKGWTLDADSPTTSLDVHVYIGGAAGDSNVEGHVIKANLERSDIAAAYPGAGSAHGFDAVINTSKSGNQPVYVYGINVGAGGNALLNNSGARVNIIADTAAPTINDVKVSNVSGRGYTVTCKVSDNVGVTKVTMPTWTVKNGQDDLVWHTATISGNTATSHVSIGDHNLESGDYLTHIYAYDAAGNRSSVAAPVVTLPNILSGPTASGTLKDGVYTIASSLNRNLVLDVAKASKNSGANIQVWTAANSENQLWYIKSLGSGLYSVRALHSGRYINVAGSGKANGTNLQQWNNGTPNGDEKWRITNNGDGTYTFIAAVNGLALDLADGKTANGQNAQCWQTNGSGAQRWVLYRSNVQADFSGPSISNIRVTEVSPKGYRVTCTVTDPSGVAKVTMPTWSVKNNQDDIVWHEAAISGNTATFYVRVSDHNDEAGDYLTHIYATDKRGYLSSTSAGTIHVPEDTKGPEISNIRITEVSSGGFRATCTVTDPSGVKKVTMPTWTEANGQDDLVWHEATLNGNTATFYVKASDHKNEPGKYIMHIYAYDTKGQVCSVPVSAITVPTIVGGTPVTGKISDGVYTIASSLNQNIVLDVAEVSKNSGANIHVWTAANSENQLWYIKSLGSGLYSVRALHSGRYINVAGSGKANGTNLQQWNNGTPNGDEKWRITNNGDGTYTFIAAVNGLALDLADGKTANGQNAQCWQTNGSGAQRWVLYRSNVQADFSGPSISNIRVTEVSPKGYRVTCTVTDPSGVAKVTMPTWSVKNNQDDIVWHEAAISGNTATFYVRVSDHNDEAGDYLTHIYATDKRGYQSSNSAGTIHVPEDKQGPEISNVQISEVTPNGFRVTCTVTDETGVARVKMPTWSDRNGSDDLVWHEATLNGNTATFYVRTADHKSETGSYTTHIYADDTRGNTSSTAAPTIHVPFGVPDGYYRLASAVDNSKGLDIAGVSTDNGANAHLWTYGDSSNQKFELKYQNGYYTLMALHSGKYIDVANGSNVAGANVQQYQGNGSDAQQWMLKDAGDGYAYVVNKSGLYLDVNGTFSDNGTNVQVWTGNGSVAQKWKLIPVEKEVRKGYDAGYTGGMAGSGSIVAYGIDVSEHQGTGFNFQNLKNSGYSYVILRCGFVTRKDYRFEEYYAAAKAAGLNVGVYFYSYASTPAEASYEADRCLSYIQGKKFEYPVYFDFEDGSARSYNGALAQQICNAFLSKIEAAGYLPGLYGYASWLDPNYGAWVPTSSICSKWECWMANYYNGSPVNVKSANYPSTYGMYQYTSSNYVNGVGPLDTNVCYKDYPYIVKTYHFNGY